MKAINYQNYIKPSDFLVFPEGESKIRIVSNGGIGKKHGMKTATGFIPLGECTETESCEFCMKGNEPKMKWMWIVYSYSQDDVKLLDTGPMVGDAICKIAQKRNQDPQEYDLIIKRVGQGRSSKYSVSMGDIKAFTVTSLIKSKKQFLINKYFLKKPLTTASQEE